MNKYVISNNYYTTDANIIYKLKKSSSMEIVAEFLACFAALCFAAMFVFIFLKINFIIPLPIIFLFACVLFAVISYVTDDKSVKLESEALNEFYMTKEYEEQREENAYDKKMLQEKRVYEKAKYLVEIFYTLNNKRMSKKSKIQRLKNIFLNGKSDE